MRDIIYYFDSDVLITAKNHYYNFSFAELFWDWFQDGVRHGIFKSAINVKNEILDGAEDDLLRIYTENGRFDEMWCDTKNNIEIASKFGKLQNWASSVWATPDKRTKKNAANLTVALNTFASDKKADAWLVALASHSQQSLGNKSIICTNEVGDLKSIKRIMLPDAAKSQNVETINLFNVLRKYSGKNFKFEV